LVDYANQRMSEGVGRRQAMLEAGRTRLRPILMTSFALIAGMIPVAVGLNEASKQRTSLGIAIIGGTISSTLLTLLVVPAAFDYIDRFRMWVNRLFFKYVGSEAPGELGAAVAATSSDEGAGEPV
jgi:HAE1 family hydrophobic/amphiphilic exporter-1